MAYPEFFKTVQSIALYDDLSDFLGVNDGLITFSYEDVVKTAGHSCATVAGAYLVAQKGLALLFGEEMPQRGYIKVEIKKAPRDDNAGVVGCVLANITGATDDFGFGGIPTGLYNRRDTLSFEANIDYDVCFTNIKTGKKVGVNYMPQKAVKPMAILMSAIKEDAKAEDIESFPRRFQEMVAEVFAHADTVIETKVYS